METTEKKSGATVKGFYLLLAVGTTLLLFTGISYLTTRKSLINEKLRNETLAREKRASDQAYNLLNEKFRDLVLDSKGIKSEISRLKGLLDKKEQEIEKLVRENATVKKLRNQLTALLKEKESLSVQVNEMKTQAIALRDQNSMLSEENQHLRKENELLTQNQELRNSLNANNFRIDVLKGRKENILTVRARRAKKVVMNLDAPEEIAQNLRLQLVSPDGKTYEKYQGLTYSVTGSTDGLIASLTEGAKSVPKISKVEMVFRPDKKMKSGLYRINIYNQDSYIATCEVQLK